MKRPFVLVCVASLSSFIVGWHCGSASKTMDHAPEVTSMSLRQVYRARVKAWNDALQTDPLRFTDYPNNHPLYEEIVKLGHNGLPYMIADIEAGDWGLNDAVIRITKVELGNLYPNEYVESRPMNESKLLVRWWKDIGQAQYGVNKAPPETDKEE